MMSFYYIPALEIFLGILGFGFLIMFCTAFCKVCHRIREDQMEREEWRRGEEGRPHSVYFIPFPGSGDHQRSTRYSQELHITPRYSQELHIPPQHAYSTPVYSPPPSYNELGCKPEDLPPAYSEYTNVPIHPITPPHQTDMAQPQPHSQP